MHRPIRYSLFALAVVLSNALLACFLIQESSAQDRIDAPANPIRPAQTDPATTNPANADPATTDPATSDPATTDPATTDPATTDPATTDPADPATNRAAPADDTADFEEAQRETIERLRARIMDIDKIPLNISPAGDSFPTDYAKLLFKDRTDSYANRNWAVMPFHWEASELIFQPPYWEDTPLERYGQTTSPKLQPVISGAHFFGTFAIIPYKIGIDRTHDHISTLGYYRPGSPVPCLRQRLPFEWDAALMEAGAWTSGVFIFP